MAKKKAALPVEPQPDLEEAQDDELKPGDDLTPEEALTLAIALGKRPWRRTSGEPNRWYRRFQTFYRVGPRRSLLAVINLVRAEKGQPKSDEIPGAWRLAVLRWNWKARAEAFDEHQSQLEDVKWAKRRDQLRNREWELAEKILDKALQMLAFPLASTSREERGPDGQPLSITTVNPTRWSMRDAAQMLEMASKVARLSAEMRTASVEVNWQTEAMKLGLDPAELLNVVLSRLEQQTLARRADAGGAGDTPTQSETPEQA